MAEYTLYDVTVSTLTPLHIGSGVELLHEYDYAIHQGRTWRIDELALLYAQQVDAQSEDALALAERLARTPPAQLLQPSDFRDGSPFFRYVIQGAPRSNAEGAQLREQIKDAYDRPYLPGSSLKGALRTALGWYVWGLRKYVAKPAALGRSDKWAAQAFERDLFGSSPNYDWLRVLHVADSAPLPPDTLTVLNASVLKRNGDLAAPIELEALPHGVQFKTTIKLDWALYSDWAAKLNFEHRGLLLHLPEVVQRHTQDQVRRAAAWAAELPNGEQLRARYARLAADLPKNQCLLQLGWGTGWTSKTFGGRLLTDEPLKAAMFSRYRLTRGRGSAVPAQFPSTRRVVVDVDRDAMGRTVTTPRSPFGWCLVEMKERAR